ncbi:SHOCT domain-containing protein [Microbacterium sp. F51-2R]|jgi:putative membrane protein|uniref:SHOCT domain-containing protein n=1 Tax=Microbacterium sp. F51-2R TaxID=3445777 RepID=UPI003FA12D1A
MMYGHGFGWGWMWLGGILLLLILAALIILIVRMSTSGQSTGAGQAPRAAPSSARQIAEERLARGEITPDEFRQIARALDEHP